MFDVGFWELVVIGIVALIVIGPERLPGVARTVGLWTGRMRRFVANVKADIEREVKAEELKRIIEEQAKNTGIHEIIEETRAVADELNRTGQLANETVTPDVVTDATPKAVSQAVAPAIATDRKPDAEPSQKHHG